VPVYSM